MHASFSTVADLLHTEAGICRELLEMAKRERVAMLQSRPELLNALAVEKETLIQRLQVVERQREEWVGRLARQLGCEAAELTLIRLVQAAPPAFEAALADCRAELSGLLERLRTENRRNTLLCRHTAELLRSFYGTAKGWATTGPVYQSRGRMLAAQLNGRLLSQEM